MRPNPARALLPWIVVGPLCLSAGILVGRSWSSRTSPPVWTDAPAEAQALGFPSFAPIVRSVRGGVVGVRTVRRVDAEAVEPGNVAPPAEGTAEATSRGVSGSGFVINAAGLVVTNYHLVADYDRILVELPGWRPQTADLVGVDPVTDVAVVRLTEVPPAGLTVLPLGDSSEVEQGDWVVAVGNPFRYRHTVTVGVVSHVGRLVPEEGLLVSNELLQFSAPVNPGSSGGPVLDLHGHVVGVTTSTLGAGTDISFAVPSKVLRRVLEAMETQGGRVRRGFLGVRLEPLDDLAFPGRGGPSGAGAGSGGALVRHVLPDSPAARAGLTAGDVVVSFASKPVPDAFALFDWITWGRPGEDTALEVVRNGERLPPMVVQLGEVQVPGASNEGRGPTH